MYNQNRISLNSDYIEKLIPNKVRYKTDINFKVCIQEEEIAYRSIKYGSIRNKIERKSNTIYIQKRTQVVVIQTNKQTKNFLYKIISISKITKHTTSIKKNLQHDRIV